jgi:large subunit ribosomal protein L3
LKKALLAKKIGMTQIFGETGILIPVTVLEAGPCAVTQVKTLENDGYEAVQIGFWDVKEKHLTKPEKGHLAKAKVAPKKHLREFKLENASEYTVGSELKADVFAAGEKVDISGISKGKGYQGAIKKYNQHRGPMTHGSKYHRHAGAMAGSTWPGKVKKGKGLPSHMGAEAVTVQNLEVVRTDAERNIILVKGAVPGARGSLVAIKSTVKN